MLDRLCGGVISGHGISSKGVRRSGGFISSLGLAGWLGSRSTRSPAQLVHSAARGHEPKPEVLVLDL